MSSRLGISAFAILVIGTALFLGHHEARADVESYGVFCASSRIEIDIRSDEQMRGNRGACSFGRFPSRTDAENFVRHNFGSVGARCSCR